VAYQDYLTYLGHATVLIEVDGVRVMTDPVLRPGATMLHRMPKAADLREYTEVDLVVISHLHHDHLDLPSLRLLKDDPLIVVPYGAERWMRSKGFTNITEMAPGDVLNFDGVTVRATMAVHSGKREPRGPVAMAIGYVIEAGEATIYFAGDTDIFPGMADLVPGELDVAMIPVWGWGLVLGDGHLNPQTAADAVALLRPRYAVPIHWGTLAVAGLHRLKFARMENPPHEFAEAVAALGIDTEVLITHPGERVAFEP
jgi:L-ascorbate metabolism protein UlaG (beta-lactamase superfamily)